MSTKSKIHFLRGGSWDYIAEYCRVADHRHDNPDRRSYGRGFRLVKNKPKKKDERAKSRVLRGGSWGNFAVYSCVIRSDYCNPDSSYFSFGFRVVKQKGEQKMTKEEELKSKKYELEIAKVRTYTKMVELKAWNDQVAKLIDEIATLEKEIEKENGKDTDEDLRHFYNGGQP